MKPEKPVVNVKPHSYQPSQAEIKEDVTIDRVPDDLALAVLRQVTVVEDRDA